MDVDLINYFSGIEVDKTIADFKGQMVIPSGGENTINHVLPVGAGHTFWEGTYTLDSYTQQNDIGGLQYTGLQGAGLEARSYEGGILVRGVNTTGSNVTADYNLSVIASPETGIVPSKGIFSTFDNPIAFDSRDNHRKILLTRAYDSSTDLEESFDSPLWQKIVFRGDNAILSETNRVKVFIVLADGYMYDVSAHYGRSQVSIADNEVIACFPVGTLGGVTPSPDAYVRYFYE